MPVSLLKGLVRDWGEESASLESVLRSLGAEDWDRQTPAPGWTVRHQIAHLSWTDDALQLALTSPEDFGDLSARVGASSDAVVSHGETGAGAAPGVLLG